MDALDNDANLNDHKGQNQYKFELHASNYFYQQLANNPVDLYLYSCFRITKMPERRCSLEFCARVYCLLHARTFIIEFLLHMYTIS